jgi:hypothetical protein
MFHMYQHRIMVLNLIKNKKMSKFVKYVHRCHAISALSQF